MKRKSSLFYKLRKEKMVTKAYINSYTYYFVDMELGGRSRDK